jgi:hypothetical protein
MALEVEGVVDGSVHAEKTLGGASRSLREAEFSTDPALATSDESHRGVAPKAAVSGIAHSGSAGRKVLDLFAVTSTIA